LLVLGSVVALGPVEDGKRVRVEDGPKYASDGQLLFPKEYREWVFLSSGLDMSYDPKPRTDGMHMFNNVFVNPAAYTAFQATGHWPDGTELVLENRGAEAPKSINTKGNTQSKELLGFEVHVLDSAHAEAKSDGWEFYGFQNTVSAKPIARPASWYSCHEAHAAVETTFVQFYPTLTETAEKKQTLSAAYLKEISGK